MTDFNLKKKTGLFCYSVSQEMVVPQLSIHSIMKKILHPSALQELTIFPNEEDHKIFVC